MSAAFYFLKEDGGRRPPLPWQRAAVRSNAPTAVVFQTSCSQGAVRYEQTGRVSVLASRRRFALARQGRLVGSSLCFFELPTAPEPHRCSAGVLACGSTRRPAGCSFRQRDAVGTRSRDDCATNRFMGCLASRKPVPLTVLASERVSAIKKADDGLARAHFPVLAASGCGLRFSGLPARFRSRPAP